MPFVRRNVKSGKFIKRSSSSSRRGSARRSGAAIMRNVRGAAGANASVGYFSGSYGSVRAMPTVTRMCRKAPLMFLEGYTSGGTSSAAVNGANVSLTDLQILGTADTTYSLNNSFNIGFARSFQLQDVSKPGDFTSLFDSFRIRAVTVAVRFDSATESITSTQTPIPLMTYWLDEDSLTAPTRDAMEQRGNTKKVMIANGKTYNLKFRPKPTALVYRAGVSSGYAEEGRRWIDCNSSDIPHYSFCAYFENLPITPAGTVRDWKVSLDVNYELEFKGVQ